MKVKYSNLSKYSKLALGLLWAVLGIQRMTNGEIEFNEYLLLVLSFIYLFMFFIELTKNYVEVENGKITIQGYFSKKNVEIKELINMEEKGRDFVLRTMDKKLIINNRRILKNDYKELITEIEKQKAENV